MPRLIVDGFCLFTPVLLQSKTDTIQFRQKRGSLLPAKSESAANFSSELAIIFSAKCVTFSVTVNLFSSPASHLSKFTLQFFGICLLNIRLRSTRSLRYRLATTSSFA